MIVKIVGLSQEGTTNPPSEGPKNSLVKLDVLHLFTPMKHSESAIPLEDLFSIFPKVAGKEREEDFGESRGEFSRTAEVDNSNGVIGLKEKISWVGVGMEAVKVVDRVNEMIVEPLRGSIPFFLTGLGF